MQNLIAGFPGVGCLRADHQALIPGLIEVVGAEAFGKVWRLYQEARLIFFADGRWQMWGYVDNIDGTSRGPVPHSLVVARLNVILTKKLGLGREKVVLAALAGGCHDNGKRDERENPLDNVGAHQRARARTEAAFGAGVAELAECAGHSGMELVLLDLGNPLPKIMFLADQMVEGVEVKKVKVKSRRLLEESAQGKHSYDEGGVTIFGQSYFAMQDSLADSLEAEMSMRFDILPVTDLAAHLTSLLLDESV